LGKRLEEDLPSQSPLKTGRSSYYPILGHKGSLNKYKKIEITPYNLSDHNTIKLELNNKSNSRKYANN
jgi:hypothetical protein